jgi:glycerol-3-phosphate acyltransferase PlsY
MLIDSALVILGYLSGSIASALLVCRALGLADPREAGSGNPGATNMLRLHGRGAALLTLAGDVLKGFLPVLLARLLEAPPAVIALTGLAAFGGHLFPVFFGFRGGKGVATLIGVLFASHWLAGLVFCGIWLLVALLSRYSSLSSLVAAAFSPLYVWLILGDPAYLAGFGLMAVLLFWRHRDNIRNLLNGTETKIGAKTGE